MNIFRGIFNRMQNRGRRPGADDSDSDVESSSDPMGRPNPTQQQASRPPRRLPKQFNSDWNTIVEETGDNNTNLFFSIFSAPQQASSHETTSILAQNKAKVRRQIQLRKQAAKTTNAEKQGVEDAQMTADDQQKSDVKDDVKAEDVPPIEDKEMTDEDALVKKDKGEDDDEDDDPLLTSEAPDKEVADDDEEPKRHSLLDQLSSDGGEESKQDVEESKQAANQRLKDHREFEFLRNTKYSEYYQRLIPNKHYRSIRADAARIYGGRFTTKGNLYYCSSQESINLYDTRDPYNWTLRSKIDAQNIRWTVTDMDVSPDEQFMVYSSIDPYVRLVDLDTMRRKQEFIDLSGTRDEGNHWGGGGIAIMSLKLSGDGKEVLGGTKGAHLLVYDLIAGRMVNKVDRCHSDEINSVCFANRQHSNIVFSGSDDGLVKVWDRRALSSNRPAGVFVGHAEGVTNIASKGDGIYLASNGKDQLLKVWDIRQSVSYDKFRNMSMPQQDPGFDYRYGSKYRFLNRQPKHFADKSVFTFKGHQVYSTLIRCQFSPLETTGQRYVYTGSSDGKLHIYDLVTGDTAGVLQKKSPSRSSDGYGYGNASPARDISWHPFMPVLASTEFNGNVNIWSMQNIGEEERQKMAEQAATKQSSVEGHEYGAEEDEQESDEEDNSLLSALRGRGGGAGSSGGTQYVMIRGQGGQVYRVPLSMLRQIMGSQDDENDEEEENPDEEEKKDGEGDDQQEQMASSAQVAAKKAGSDDDQVSDGVRSSDNNDGDEEMPALEAKLPAKPSDDVDGKASEEDGEDDWDMDDVVDWGETKKDEPKVATTPVVEEEKKEESALESLQRINREHQEAKQGGQQVPSEAVAAATSTVENAVATIAAEEPSSAVFNGSINDADDDGDSDEAASANPDAKKDEDVEME